nr:MAGUK p55 subfamily member 5-like isoform X1 [Ciona intestinalis]|eukprot:XP_026689598.1 MAGUK p55 subfamily member 5-like isoform X1 [Ciona intestinalis]
MSSLCGYVVLIVGNGTGRIKLYGSPYKQGSEELTPTDHIIQINGSTFDTCSYISVLKDIGKCISTKTIRLRVHRGSFSQFQDSGETSKPKRAVAFAVEPTGEKRLLNLQLNGSVKRIEIADLPESVQTVLAERTLYLTDFLREESSSKSSNELSDNSIISLSNNSITSSPKNQKKMAMAEMPRSHNRYRLNGGPGTVLPPDETTHEMAVDCPAAYVAANPPRSGISTPRGNFDVPPPTPLDSTAVSSQKNKTTKDLEAAAAAAETLPQPDMNFQRIHRMRESVKRQKEQKLRDMEVRHQMKQEEGAKKLERLKHMTPEQEVKSRKQGFENYGFERDSYIHTNDEEKQPMGIESMFVALKNVGTKINDPSLSDDLSFLRHVVQDDDFQDSLELYNVITDSTKPKTSAPIIPVSKDMQTISSDVREELMFSQLPQAEQLTKILSDVNINGVMLAHDEAAEYLYTPEPVVDVNVNTVEDEEILQRVSQYTDKAVRVVRIDKSNDALGATVRSEDDGSVTISRIISGGVADKTGLLHEGDELIEVNGKSMRGLDVNEVGDVIAGMNGTLVFVLASNKSNGVVKTDDLSTVVKHVRALFDYDAFDDPYLPCRELGLSFQKGDVLRVMSMEDDWWQAYRDDDDTHLSLAGLIPSQQFQQQRETLRMSLIKESKAPESKKSYLCGRKKKKAKNESTSQEDEDDEPIQTYEEMALYHQPETKKRPIVLIGPPNVGRHELRQRLVDNDRDRFGSAIPHTSRHPNEGERGGVDYHFVSISEFEAMVTAQKFLEHGAYQKNLYGTTIKAVQKIIDIEKICVLNLHAESLRALSTSGLKPYIVFIAPPPLEKLRQNMSKEGKQIKEDELRRIIENARDIERRYAHYFDETIRNTDLNRSYAELLRLINKLDSEPQWVPASWLD